VQKNKYDEKWPPKNRMIDGEEKEEDNEEKAPKIIKKNRRKKNANSGY